MKPTLDFVEKLDHRLRTEMRRTNTVGTRVTAPEEKELSLAAQRDRKNLSEWTREVLLRETRRSDHDAVFTEIVATRMLLVNLIKPLILGKPVTSQWITEVMTAVRREKRRAAQEVLQQYADDAKGDR
jgi:hypothetical protein